MNDILESYEKYAYYHNGCIRHKDSWNQELKVGDVLIVGGYYGNLYKGKVIGDTEQFIKIVYYNYVRNSWGDFPSNISPGKTYKIY